MYFERGKVNDTRAGLFCYCEDAKSWVFTIPALRSIMDKRDNSTGMTCGGNGWLTMSPMTEAYKLEDVELTNWIVVAGSGIIMTAKDLFLGCGECKRDFDCSLNGVCKSGSCECYEGWQGRVCNLQAPGMCSNHECNTSMPLSAFLPIWPFLHCIVVDLSHHNRVQGNGFDLLWRQLL
jgi:hypothetical protein